MLATNKPLKDEEPRLSNKEPWFTPQVETISLLETQSEVGGAPESGMGSGQMMDS